MKRIESVILVALLSLLLIECSGSFGFLPLEQRVAYDANGGTAGSVPVDTTLYKLGQVVTVLANTGGLARTGYEFEGWNTASDAAGTCYLPEATFVMGALGVTLFAQWLPDPGYMVIYDGNGNTGGTVPISDQTYGVGAMVRVAEPGTLTRTGSSFQSWNTTADGNGTNHMALTSLTMGTEDITLYAKWTEFASIW